MSKHLLPARLSFSIVGACALLAIGAAAVENVQADGLKFVICKHATGLPVGVIKDSRGIDAAGVTVVTKETVTGVVPSPEDKCTVVESTKGAVSVVGSAQEVYCRIYGCYEWPSNGK